MVLGSVFKIIIIINKIIPCTVIELKMLCCSTRGQNRVIFLKKRNFVSLPKLKQVFCWFFIIVNHFANYTDFPHLNIMNYFVWIHEIKSQFKGKGVNIYASQFVHKMHS